VPDTDGRVPEQTFGVSLSWSPPAFPEDIGRIEHQTDTVRTTAFFDTADTRLAARGVILEHADSDATTTTGAESAPGTWTLTLPGAAGRFAVGPRICTWSGERGALPPEILAILHGVRRNAPLVSVAEFRTVRRHLVLHDTQGAPAGDLFDDTLEVTHGARNRASCRQIIVRTAELSPLGARLATWLTEAGATVQDTPVTPVAFVDLPLGTPRGARGQGITRDSTLGEVIQASITDGLFQLLDHELRLRATLPEPQEEDIHQARVATRRLRSDLKTFEPVLDSPWVVRIRGEIQRVGEALGAVRDADVHAEYLAGCVKKPADADASEELHAHLAAQRRAAIQELATLLGDERYLRLLEELATAAAHPPFSPPLESAAVALRAPSPEHLARKALPSLVRRPWRALRRRVRHAGRHPEDWELHQIRIRAKQVRYAAEMATPTIGKPAARTARRAAALQGVLGDHHDAVAMELWLKEASADRSPAARVLADRLIAEERRRQRDLRRRWRPVWEELNRKQLHRWLE
jgi:CHAD domain-containing protein